MLVLCAMTVCSGGIRNYRETRWRGSRSDRYTTTRIGVWYYCVVVVLMMYARESLPRQSQYSTSSAGNIRVQYDVWCTRQTRLFFLFLLASFARDDNTLILGTHYIPTLWYVMASYSILYNWLVIHLDNWLGLRYKSKKYYRPVRTNFPSTSRPNFLLGTTAD